MGQFNRVGIMPQFIQALCIYMYLTASSKNATLKPKPSSKMPLLYIPRPYFVGFFGVTNFLDIIAMAELDLHISTFLTDHL